MVIRGLYLKDFVESSWFRGFEFLRNILEIFIFGEEKVLLSVDDFEVRKESKFVMIRIMLTEFFIMGVERFKRYLFWFFLRRVIVVLIVKVKF